jgi:predicted Zn-dependent protease
MLADCYRAVGREDRALPLLDRAASHYPRDAEVQADRALFFSRVSWLPEAQAALRRMGEGGAETEHIELVRIAVAREAGDLKTARRLLESARQRDPSSMSVLQQLAAVMNEDGETEASVRLLAGSDGVGQDRDTQILLARILAQQATLHSLQRALVALDRAQAVQHLEPGEELLRARCLRLSGHAAEARPILEGLYRRAPMLPGLSFELAQVYRETSSEQAIAAPAALMAQHEREQREEDEMRRAVLALRDRPGEPSVHSRAGLICLRRRLYGRAIMEMERALALRSAEPGVRDGLAEARRKVELSAARARKP